MRAECPLQKECVSVPNDWLIQTAGLVSRKAERKYNFYEGIRRKHLAAKRIIADHIERRKHRTDMAGIRCLLEGTPIS